MENIEFFQDELSLAGEIAVSHKNNILTDRISLQISGRKQISAQPVVNGTTVHSCRKGLYNSKKNLQYFLIPECSLGLKLSSEYVLYFFDARKDSRIDLF